MVIHMTKRKTKKQDDSPLLVFKTDKQKKYFILMLIDFILLCAMGAAGNMVLMLFGSVLCLYLLIKHFRAYHFAIKETGGIS